MSINMTTDRRQYNFNQPKVTIHVLDLTDRGKWIDINLECEFTTLNFTDKENAIFTSMGWNGLASITVDIMKLENFLTTLDGEFSIEDIRKGTNLPRQAVHAAIQAVGAEYKLQDVYKFEPAADADPTSAIEFFNAQKPARSRKIDSIPADAVALDDSSRRYKINFSKVMRYRDFSKKHGYCVEDYFCLASDAPACVKEVLNY